MSEPLRIGDRVICRHPDGTFLREGTTYTVLETMAHRERPGMTVGLNLFPGMHWGAWRFEPLPPTTQARSR